ncbi:hypothetical protein L6164_009930 [Bauhinia variegata]|uniref:Uncharacterized protein n=1 Tax=Bauhinia variegata TaxID=167791 RepID=A0ACB9PMY3_BAUVA|nr:hypothetical protein L6164_009930 [Bauhinia variegata]
MPTGRRGGGGPTLPPPSWSESTRGGGLGPRRPNRRTITITMSGNSRARVYGVAKGIKPGIGRLCPPLFCSFSVILWIPNGSFSLGRHSSQLISYRELKELVKLKMAITQQHGRWKSQLQQKKMNWGSIFIKCARTQNYTGGKKH